MAAGLADGMSGMRVGETRDIIRTLPDDFEPAKLRGVDVTCTIRIAELFEYEPAEVLLAFFTVCIAA